MKNWLLNLIREAVSLEVEQHFRTLEDKTARIESHFANIAVRVKEKQEQKQKSLLGQQWGAISQRAEQKSAEGSG